MDTEKKTGERIGITLALLACVGFSAFLIWLQQKQEKRWMMQLRRQALQMEVVQIQQKLLQMAMTERQPEEQIQQRRTEQPHRL